MAKASDFTTLELAELRIKTDENIENIGKQRREMYAQLSEIDSELERRLRMVKLKDACVLGNNGSVYNIEIGDGTLLVYEVTMIH